MKEFLRQQLTSQKEPLSKTNLAREYLQARILQSLQEEGAFLNWAFLGGTALRFLYGIPRYSEDLDFSLADSLKHCPFEDILKKIRARMNREDYAVEIKVSREKAVRSAWIKFPGLPFEMGISPHRSEVFSIKLEVDTCPPPGARTETTLCRRFVTLNLMHYDKASLLAGKLHACLTRQYAKGRDWYDLIWYLADRTGAAPNLVQLQNALNQTQGASAPDAAEWKQLLLNRLNEIDCRKLVDDVAPFLERPEEAALLNLQNFRAVLESAR